MPEPKPVRDWYGRKLEPKNGLILHGAGQADLPSFRNYAQSVHPNRPFVYMTYAGLDTSVNELNRYFSRLRGELSAAGEYVIPQIGLGMTHDGKPEEHYEHRVAAGEFDPNIQAVCRGLKELGCPAFVRLGFEFNGRWNGYVPTTFIDAWRRVVSAFHTHQLDEIAVVWCYASDIRNQDNMMNWYPGDEWVDWWGIDLFSVEHFTADDTLRYMQESIQHRFPVMIGESTPRFVGVLDGPASWDKWFVPYFQFMRDYPNVRSFCYINWDWAGYPAWHNWGDCRLEMNDVVRTRYAEEMRDPRYVHDGRQKAIRSILGLH